MNFVIYFEKSNKSNVEVKAKILQELRIKRTAKNKVS